MKVLVIGQHLAHLVTHEVLRAFKEQTGEDFELRVAEPVAIKERPPAAPEPRPLVNRAEQRRRNKMIARRTRR